MNELIKITTQNGIEKYGFVENVDFTKLNNFVEVEGNNLSRPPLPQICGRGFKLTP